MTSPKGTDYDYCSHVCWRWTRHGPLATCRLYPSNSRDPVLRGTYETCDYLMTSGKCPRPECVSWDINDMLKEKPQG